MKNLVLLSALFNFFLSTANAQSPEQVHPLQSNIPYGRTTAAEVKTVMDRVLNYVEQVTPVGIVNRVTGEKISDLKTPVKEATFAKGEFDIFTHEWGLAYSGMLMAGEATSNLRFRDYVSRRFEFLIQASAYFRAYKKVFPNEVYPLEHLLEPASLDDTGSLCAAMIQALRAGMANELRPEIDHSINFIMTKVHR